MNRSLGHRCVLSVAMVLLVAGTGCFWPFQRGEPKPPTMQLNFEGMPDLNRGRDSIAHSVVVTVYQLTAPSKFESSTAAELLRDDTQALGAELLEKHQVTLEPSSKKAVTITLAKNTKFVGASADFFLREGNTWRQLSPLKEKQKQMTIEVRGRQVRIR